MKIAVLLLIGLCLRAAPARAQMSASGMKAKIMAAYHARTGKTMTDGDFNVLQDICQGVIDEIVANAELTLALTQNSIPVSVNPGTGTGATTAQGTVTGKVK